MESFRDKLPSSADGRCIYHACAKTITGWLHLVICGQVNWRRYFDIHFRTDLADCFQLNLLQTFSLEDKQKNLAPSNLALKISTTSFSFVFVFFFLFFSFCVVAHYNFTELKYLSIKLSSSWFNCCFSKGVCFLSLFLAITVIRLFCFGLKGFYYENQSVIQIP